MFFDGLDVSELAARYGLSDEIRATAARVAPRLEQSVDELASAWVNFNFTQPETMNFFEDRDHLVRTSKIVARSLVGAFQVDLSRPSGLGSPVPEAVTRQWTAQLGTGLSY